MGVEEARGVSVNVVDKEDLCSSWGVDLDSDRCTGNCVASVVSNVSLHVDRSVGIVLGLVGVDGHERIAARDVLVVLL